MEDHISQSNKTNSIKFKRVYFSCSKRMISNYVLYARSSGFHTISEALRSGIKMCIDGSLELRSNIDENTLPTVDFLEKTYGNLVRWKHDSNDFEVHLEEGLLKRFDGLRLQKGFKSRSKLINCIMLSQMFDHIQDWKKLHGNQRKKLNGDNTDNRAEGEKKLKQILAKYVEDFGFGSEFELEWIPKTESKVDGEIVGKKIFIYSKTLEEAEKTLRHDYFEYLFKTVFFSLPLASLLNKVIEITNQELYKLQEKIIEKIVNAMAK